MTDNDNERDQLIAELRQAAREAMGTHTRLELLAWAMLLEDMGEIRAALSNGQEGEG